MITAFFLLGCARVNAFTVTPAAADPNAIDVAFDAHGIGAWSLVCTSGDEHVHVDRDSASDDGSSPR